MGETVLGTSCSQADLLVPRAAGLAMEMKPRPRFYIAVAHLCLLFPVSSGVRLPEDKPSLSGDLRDSAGGKSKNSLHRWESASNADQQDGTYPPGPPRIYKTLAQRPIGRHVLAGSSLFAECVRVYAPSPLSGIWTRLGRMLLVHEVAGSTLGERSRPGMTYDRFMSNGDGSDEEDPPEDELITPSDKYRRVSSSFLVRHGISHLAAPPCSPSLPDAVQHKSTTPTTPMPPPPASATGVFSFNPLSTLRMTRRSVEDDLDLLSDVGENKLARDVTAGGETSEQTGEGRARRHTRTVKGGDRSDRSAEARARDAMLSQTSGRMDPDRALGTKRTRRGGRSEKSFARSLISADDTEVALVKKLRQAALGHEDKSSV